jgi:hypothetical protein
MEDALLYLAAVLRLSRNRGIEAAFALWDGGRLKSCNYGHIIAHTDQQFFALLVDSTKYVANSAEKGQV